MVSSPLDLPNLYGKTLLVVEDNADHLDLMSTFLKACRAEVLEALNADTALAYLQTRRIDMVISDLSMPGKDGISLIRTMRAGKGQQRTLPVIAVTGYPEQYVGARAEGFDVFVQKPIRVEVLAKILREFFASPSKLQ